MRSDPILRVLLQGIKSDGSDWVEAGLEVQGEEQEEVAEGGGGLFIMPLSNRTTRGCFLIDDIVPIY